MTAVLLFLGGLVLLVAGGELLVRGATLLARLAGLTPAVIGLTVVAMGTSMPELAVGLMAAARGQPDIAVGNVIGSNIFNVTAALGIAALVHALPVRGAAVRLEWPVMFGASALCAVLLRDLRLERVEGAFLVLCLVLFTAYSVHLGRREVRGAERAEFAESADDRSLHPGRLERLTAAAAVLGGVALLVVGGRLLVSGAVDIARLAGMTERVIGLTVVAAGTGMPEVVTSAVAAARRQTDVAVANMIGSNVFNLLGILGVTALVHPIPVAPALAGPDLLWMMGTALLLLPVLWRGMRIDRWEGGVLIGAYGVYLWTLVG
ncbi:MAG TPA: calcium/sodium antiporter [Longimicrobiaceae bacterium]|nr:calcium/sodium antiporter [Longimicrobiaceae bacterium]